MERLKILKRHIEASKVVYSSNYKDIQRNDIITEEFLNSIKNKSPEDKKVLMVAKEKVLQFFSMK